ncbi:hypothetical protein QAD02_011159 [Eretmocerus hayati]|uniref:Uncharacterized protein n=1 Tax=Eretmocerus hayati TaxID=131215 RepID=A0ACC2NWY7_9HYME|nr:hypothetical protein QAD02_011159 [Eretmocerus hayati]
MEESTDNQDSDWMTEAMEDLSEISEFDPESFNGDESDNEQINDQFTRVLQVDEDETCVYENSMHSHLLQEDDQYGPRSQSINDDAPQYDCFMGSLYDQDSPSKLSSPPLTPPLELSQANSCDQDLHSPESIRATENSDKYRLSPFTKSQLQSASRTISPSEETRKSPESSDSEDFESSESSDTLIDTTESSSTDSEYLDDSSSRKKLKKKIMEYKRKLKQEKRKHGKTKKQKRSKNSSKKSRSKSRSSSKTSKSKDRAPKISKSKKQSSRKRGKKRSHREGQSAAKNCSQKLSTSCINNSYEREPVEQTEDNLKVPRKQKIPLSSEGGKWYSKVEYCPYCDKPFTRVDRHLQRKHKDQVNVGKFMKYEKKSTARARLIRKLVCTGNDRFVKDPIRNPDGLIIPARRIAKNKGKPVKRISNSKSSEPEETTHAEGSSLDVSLTATASTSMRNGDEGMGEDSRNERDSRNEGDSRTEEGSRNERDSMEKKQEKKKNQDLTIMKIACPECKSYIGRYNLVNHMSRVHGVENNLTVKGILARAKRSMGIYHQVATRKSKNIMSKLREDEEGDTIRTDELLCLYVNKFSERHGHVDQQNLVRAHARYLARLFLMMKSTDESINVFEDCFRGKHWDHMLTCIKDLVGYDGEKSRVKLASAALAYGMLISRCVEILNAKYHREENPVKRQLLESFNYQFKNDYNATISSKATLTINAGKRRNRLEELPTDEDIENFMKFVETTREEPLEYFRNFPKGGLVDAYFKKQFHMLNSTTIVILTFFNRRRNMECERATLDNFNTREKHADIVEYLKDLSVEDQQQNLKYEVMVGQGKKINGIDSTIYLSAIDVESIKLMIKFREIVGIPKNNDFIFAISHDEKVDPKHLHVYTETRKLATMCQESGIELQKPELLVATAMRKQIATKFPTIQSNVDLPDFTQHMAHSQRTHTDYYRGRQKATSAGITRVLEGVKSGSPSTSKQVPRKKTFNRITLMDSSSDEEYDANQPEEDPEPVLNHSDSSILATRSKTLDDEKMRVQSSATVPTRKRKLNLEITHRAKSAAPPSENDSESDEYEPKRKKLNGKNQRSKESAAPCSEYGSESDKLEPDFKKPKGKNQRPKGRIQIPINNGLLVPIDDNIKQMEENQYNLV